MTTLELTKNYLTKRNAFTKEFHPLLSATMDLLATDIPNHLRLSISLSELITLTSQFRKHIKLHDGTLVPCNAISIGLYGSGISKDSSLSKVKRAFNPAYEVLDKKRKEYARKNAEIEALKEGESSEEWLNYYKSPTPIRVGLGTVPGMVQHFADTEDNPLGAPIIYNSEIGSELSQNGEIVDIIKTIAIAYDLGSVPLKTVKSIESRTSNINNLPVNLCVFGSQDAILFDTHIRNKFSLMFGVQLARRALFSFDNVKPILREFKSEQDIIKYHKLMRKNADTARGNIKNYLVEMTEYTNNTPLPLSAEAQISFDMYLEYNKRVSEQVSPQLPITKLARAHLQWKALKLSGNYAILDGESEISEENYILAINTVEELAPDLEAFEKELNKELYEQFVDYCRLHIGSDDKLSLSIHELKKLGYLPTTSNYQSKLDELLVLVSSYDSEGIYTKCDDGVCYEPIIKDSECGLSLLEFTKRETESPEELKQRMAKSCSSGYEFYESSFADLSEILTKYAAYSPFMFKHGKRNKDNVAGKTKWIVLDVDTSDITYKEAHLLLSDYNHHIATTKDASNEFKFRILLELDSLVDISAENWKYFIESITRELGINADLLPKSQISFAYGSEDILSVTDAETIEAKPHVINAANHVKAEQPSKLSNKAKTAALSDPRETFSYAYDHPTYTGLSNQLIKAAYHARDLGASNKEIEALIEEINNYKVLPLERSRLEQTILSQIRRWKEN